MDLKFGEDFVKVVPCSALQVDAEVVFMVYSAIHKRKVPEAGTVLWVDEDEKTIAVVWLDGYKSRQKISHTKTCLRYTTKQVRKCHLGASVTPVPS